MTSATERVETGARLLDKRRPGWEREIDTRKLRMDIGVRLDPKDCGCILAQLYEDEHGRGNFDLGVDALNVDPEDYGFTALWEQLDNPSSWDWLRRLWVRAINARRKAKP